MAKKNKKQQAPDTLASSVEAAALEAEATESEEELEEALETSEAAALEAEVAPDAEPIEPDERLEAPKAATSKKAEAPHAPALKESEAPAYALRAPEAQMPMSQAAEMLIQGYNAGWDQSLKNYSTHRGVHGEAPLSVWRTVFGAWGATFKP